MAQATPRAVRRRGGISAVLAFLAMVGALGVFLSVGLSEQDFEQGAVDAVLPTMADNSSLVIVSMWGFVVLSALLVVFAIELYRVLDDGRTGLVYGPIAVLGAAMLFATESLLTIGIVEALAPAYVGASGAEAAQIEATTLALLGFRNNAALFAGVLITVAALVFGWVMLDSRSFPAWLGYLALLVGVLGVLGALYPLVEVLSFVRVAQQGLFLVWVLLVGVYLLR